MTTVQAKMTANEANEAREASRKKGNPFCKVCFDAGNRDYETHYVKSLTGVLTCPTLQNQSCFRCGKTGHTSGYCQTKPQRPFPQQTQPSPQQMQHRVREQNNKTWSYNSKSNPFGMLELESEQPEQTMSDKLKPQIKVPTIPPIPAMPPKSQFWWQDEDD